MGPLEACTKSFSAGNSWNAPFVQTWGLSEWLFNRKKMPRLWRNKCCGFGFPRSQDAVFWSSLCGRRPRARWLLEWDPDSSPSN